jgi:hypothetical protein
VIPRRLGAGIRVAGSDGDQQLCDARLRHFGDAGDEARPSGAGLAGHQADHGVARVCPPENPVEFGELRVATDDRRGHVRPR